LSSVYICSGNGWPHILDSLSMIGLRACLYDLNFVLHYYKPRSSIQIRAVPKGSSVSHSMQFRFGQFGTNRSSVSFSCVYTYLKSNFVILLFNNAGNDLRMRGHFRPFGKFPKKSQRGSDWRYAKNVTLTKTVYGK